MGRTEVRDQILLNASGIFTIGVNAPVLFVSGYTDDEIIRSGLTRSAVHFVHKPFTIVELTAAVKKALRPAKR